MKTTIIGRCPGNETPFIHYTEETRNCLEDANILPKTEYVPPEDTRPILEISSLPLFTTDHSEQVNIKL